MLPELRILLFTLALLPYSVFASPILIETDWLADQLGANHIAIVDMSDAMQYSRFHLPGARHLPYSAINRLSKRRVSLSIGSQNIAQLMGQLGISADMHIIIYDDTGGLHASRLFWELERLGHPQLSLLNGGLVKWILEGRKVVSEQSVFPKTSYRPAKNRGRDNLAGIDSLLSAGDNTLLLDVRSEEEYLGHPRQKVSGHIPGARWWHWEDNVNFEKAFQFQGKSSLAKRTHNLGLSDKQQAIIVYCQSGHRAAHSYFTLRTLGYTNVRLYDGSIAEYSQVHPTSLKKGRQP